MLWVLANDINVESQPTSETPAIPETFSQSAPEDEDETDEDAGEKSGSYRSTARQSTKLPARTLPLRQRQAKDDEHGPLLVRYLFTFATLLTRRYS
jgi:hypothetical protein